MLQTISTWVEVGKSQLSLQVEFQMAFNGDS